MRCSSWLTPRRTGRPAVRWIAPTGRRCARRASPHDLVTLRRLAGAVPAVRGGAILNTQPLADRFAFKTADALRRKAETLGLVLPFDDDIGVLLEGTAVGGRRVPNRIAAQPMEGCDGTPEGAPDELTVRRYERFGAGGAGLIWFEATSVAADARANPRQLFITPDTAPAFSRLAEVTRTAARQRFGPGHEPYLVLQLTHSGRFSRTAPPGGRRAACHNPHLDREALPTWTDDQLDRLCGSFVEAARLAARAGFDAVDIKACHGYLLHELLGAHTRTDSRYGGPFEHRVRLLVDIVRAIRAEVPGCGRGRQAERDRRRAVPLRFRRAGRRQRRHRSRRAEAARAAPRPGGLHAAERDGRHPDPRPAHQPAIRSAGRRDRASAGASAARRVAPAGACGGDAARRPRGAGRRDRAVVAAPVLAPGRGRPAAGRRRALRRARARACSPTPTRRPT